MYSRCRRESLIIPDAEIRVNLQLHPRVNYFSQANGNRVEIAFLGALLAGVAKKHGPFEI